MPNPKYVLVNLGFNEYSPLNELIGSNMGLNECPGTGTQRKDLETLFDEIDVDFHSIPIERTILRLSNRQER